jgi:tetrahydromethanopterin S-methyltransferase subunit F
MVIIFVNLVFAILNFIIGNEKQKSGESTRLNYFASGFCFALFLVGLLFYFELV